MYPCILSKFIENFTFKVDDILCFIYSNTFLVVLGWQPKHLRLIKHKLFSLYLHIIIIILDSIFMVALCVFNLLYKLYTAAERVMDIYY